MKSFSHAIIILGLILLGFYLLIYLNFYFNLRQTMSFPLKTAPSDAASIQMLDGPKGKLTVSTHPFNGPNAVLYFGDITEDVSQTMPRLAQIMPQQAIYALHYRGYGSDSIQPGEALLHANALALFDSVLKQHPNIAIVGHSLGAEMAIKLASQRTARQLILTTPYNPLKTAKTKYRFFPVDWLLPDRYESDKLIPTLKLPTLLLLAEFDELTPRNDSKALFDAFAPGVAEMEIVKGAEHNTLIAYPDYLRLLEQTLTVPVAKRPDLERKLTDALRLNEDKLSRVGDADAAILAYAKAGYVRSKGDGRFDYSDYHILKKALTFMGHRLVIIENEYNAGYIGCCVNSGIQITVKISGSTQSLRMFAKENHCRVKTEITDLRDEFSNFPALEKIKFPRAYYAKLGCKERDAMAYEKDP
jgi:pimeloyl-ACP methyl ester carboxylesterase